MSIPQTGPEPQTEPEKEAGVDRTALCDVCRQRKPADTAEFHDLPLGGGNPYPETVVICQECKGTDAAGSIRSMAEQAQPVEIDAADVVVFATLKPSGVWAQRPNAGREGTGLEGGSYV